MIAETIALLGLRASDKVTGFAGTITTVSFDLYGCVQVVLSPPAGPDGKMLEAAWFDVNRLMLTTKRAMPSPAFAQRAVPTTYDFGAAEKPERRG